VTFESLVVEVQAVKAGWSVVKPPHAIGDSRVEHGFTLLASRQGKKVAFDILHDVGEVDVLWAFIKGMDTGIPVVIVALRGRPTDRAVKLAAEYGMRIVSPVEVGAILTWPPAAPIPA
jgi:hypothetical protein